MYYTSKILHNAEIRYSKLEKLIFALVSTMRKLQPYFQAYTMVLLTDQSIKAILYHPDTSRWIAKWSLELVKLDVQYSLQFSIKAQVLVDFILECTIPNGEGSRAVRSSKKGENSESGESSRGKEVDIGSDPKELWMLHVDGSSSAMRVGAGLILTSPEREMVGYALRFDFPTTNNEAKYKALLSGLRVAKKVGAQHLNVFSDSQLVVSHIKGGYEARKENMKRYLQKVPRANNAKTDALSKLAALLPID
ncbi:uncharacterized protein [Elaeis guineensis]|uniref:uncharacterized protein n=1 Tax=Elaeis guineensis var. tenera TaxID=51953 RepID=UPI003C6D84B7